MRVIKKSTHCFIEVKVYRSTFHCPPHLAFRTRSREFTSLIFPSLQRGDLGLGRPVGLKIPVWLLAIKQKRDDGNQCV